jgi:hypothetical protein
MHAAAPAVVVIASEAKQSSFLQTRWKKESWIASSQVLLAMTLWEFCSNFEQQVRVKQI